MLSPKLKSIGDRRCFSARVWFGYQFRQAHGYYSSDVERLTWAGRHDVGRQRAETDIAAPAARTTHGRRQSWEGPFERQQFLPGGKFPFPEWYWGEHQVLIVRRVEASLTATRQPRRTLATRN